MDVIHVKNTIVMGRKMGWGDRGDESKRTGDTTITLSTQL